MVKCWQVAVKTKPCAYGMSGLGNVSKLCKGILSQYGQLLLVEIVLCLQVLVRIGLCSCGMFALGNVSKLCKGIPII